MRDISDGHAILYETSCTGHGRAAASLRISPCSFSASIMLSMSRTSSSSDLLSLIIYIQPSARTHPRRTGDNGAIERGCTPFSISLSLWTVHIKGLVVTLLSRYQHHGTPAVAVPLFFSRRLSIFRGRSLSSLITLNSSSSARTSDVPSIENLIS